MTEHEASARLSDADRVRAFVLAGAAYFTLVSQKTGVRFTFRVQQAEVARGDGPAPHFVAVLTGQSNTDDYSYLGTIFGGTKYFHGKKSRITSDAPSAKAFDYFWRHLAAGALPEQLEFWHEGRCGRCSRRLTTPSSIMAGFGPECLAKLGNGS